ncbi:glycosyltransferase family 25 protein [Mannheimia massilioguelmaensis]|uniref:glycosyltransferase family 25 protein n=1 Tax=Mannheimia massilioguelmaensis TaxID=1604354 RepID=UPI0005C7FB6C|nr:glycosyltransferase family 25 protein [Mannheimia massilioguelmaensis]
MKKFLISLEKDVQRRELFFSQPDTADFEVFNAINTMGKDLVSLGNIFDIIKFGQYYGRNVTKGEIGCTLSHLTIYEKIINDETIGEQEYTLICEDDALFATDFQKNIDAIIQQNIGADIILTGQSKILSFNDADLEINYPVTLSVLRKKVHGTDYTYSYPYKNYFAGTVSYLITKAAARKFLNQMTNGHLPFWLADDFILFKDKFNIDSLVIRPLLVIENPNLTSNLQGLRGSLNNNLFKKVLKYPLKKLLAIKRNL